MKLKTLVTVPMLAFSAMMSTTSVQALRVADQDAPEASKPVKNDGLEEIIVSVQKIPQNAQDVPVTVNVVSGKLLAEQMLESFKDVGQLVSGITIRENNDQRNIGFLIRGIGSNQSFIGIEPSAAINVDGEVMARNSALFGDIGDINSIAILKGPQGTLFGKNTVAGAMLVKTNRPNLDESDGSLKLSTAQSGGSNFGDTNISATFNGVLSDRSALRLSLFKKDQIGWVENVMQGPNGGKSNAYGARLQYLLELGDNTDILLRADYQKRQFGPGIRVYRVRDDFVLGDGPGQVSICVECEGFDDETVQQLLTTQLHQVSQTPFGLFNDKTSAAANRDYGGITSMGTSMEINHSLSSGHTLTYTAHYRDTDLKTNDSLIGTAVDAFPLNFAGPVLSKTFQNEIRIVSPLGDKVDYIAGAFYMHSKVTREQKVLACQDPGLQNSVIDPETFEVIECGGYAFGWDEVNDGVTGLGDLIYNRELRNNDLVTDNAALFGQINFHIHPKLTFVAGARLLHERQDFSLDIRDDGIPNVDVRETLLWINDEDGNRIDYPGIGLFHVPNPDLGKVTDNPATNLDVRDPNTPFVTQRKANSDTAFTYKLALQYRPTDDLMLYSSYSTGYKGVGWFTDSDINQADLDARYPVPPETSRNLEFGFRSEWFGGNLRLNATYFDTKFSHYQDRLKILDHNIYPVVNGGLENIANDPDASGQPVQRFDIIDAGTLNSRGIDMEMVWRVTDKFKLSGSWSRVNARFADTDVLVTCGAAVGNGQPEENCTDPQNYGEFWDYTFGRYGRFFELDGAQLANAPVNTIVADASHDYSLGAWNGYVRWNYRYQSQQYTNHGGSANNDHSTTMPKVGIHNLFAKIYEPEGRFSVTLFVKNLFNTHYYARKTNYGDGMKECAVGACPSGIPGLIGEFTRQRAEHGTVPRDFDRYFGASLEMKF